MQFCSSPATAVKRSLPVVATSSSSSNGSRRSRTIFRQNNRRSNTREEEKRRRALRILRAFWNNNNNDDDGEKKGNAEEEEAEKIARALYGKEEEDDGEDDEEAERLYYQSLPRELNDGFETSWDVSDAPRDSLVVELGKLVKQKWEEEAAKQRQIIEDDDDDDSYSEFPTAPELKSVFAFPEGRDDGNDGRNGNSWIRIENVCLRSKRTFRKMHLELAWGPMDFVVLHCVIYPHASVDAPIFAGDVVGFRGRMSLSIVDLAPTTTTTKKGEGGEEEEDIFDKFVSGLESRKRIEETIEQRPLPEWGEAILSPKCVCIGGDKDESENRKQFEMFRDYFLDVMDGYLFLASAASDRKILKDAVRAYKTNEKVLSSREEEEEEDIFQKEGEDHPSFALSDAILRLKNQAFFCEKQLANEKTRSVLRRAMGDDLTERYMTEVLFDVDENTPLS
jgi:phycocyanobilin:ferredoxin oxidoreductase